MIRYSAPLMFNSSATEYWMPACAGMTAWLSRFHPVMADVPFAAVGVAEQAGGGAEPVMPKAVHRANVKDL
jgi:hypothetical protein